MPGIKYSCHKCSERSLGSQVGLVLATLLVLFGVLIVALSYLVAVVKADGHAEDNLDEARGSRKCTFSSTKKSLLEMFPLTSIKIVVVVWQILTQVIVWEYF